MFHYASINITFSPYVTLPYLIKISFQLEKAKHSEYERRMVIPRLQTLYDLGALNEEQQDSFGELLWEHIRNDMNMDKFEHNVV